jgi:hypothetical protein
LFKHYDLLHPVKWGAQKIWGLNQTSLLWDLIVTFLTFQFKSCVKYAKLCQKLPRYDEKTQGILGVNIHMYTFQIHYSTFQKSYILLTYTTIPLLDFNILLYTSIYIEFVLKSLYSAPFCLVTILFSKTILVLHYSSKTLLHLPWHIC